jgi:hypothetical protein
VKDFAMARLAGAMRHFDLENHMKLAVLITTAAFAALCICSASASEPVSAATTAHKSHHAKHAKAQNPYAELEPYRSLGFIGPYPGDYARMKATGNCVIDLGYGRSMSCDQGGGGGFN